MNNAGIAHVGNLENTSEADFDRLLSVNVKGIYNMLAAVVPAMKKQRNGAILNMASVASSVGIADRFAYSTTKGAVLTMTYSVAKDYVDFGIRCNCVAPGRVHTPFVDKYLEDNPDLDFYCPLPYSHFSSSPDGLGILDISSNQYQTSFGSIFSNTLIYLTFHVFGIRSLNAA